MEQESFKRVLAKVGARPADPATQHATRHYSETLSKEIAHWLRDLILAEGIGKAVLTPEAKVTTIYGGKSLDVGVTDDRGYLVLDISVKTFNFKDRHTRNYRHNYTGRFYELLGEELDLRRSYRWATLVALIFLPSDSTSDSDPSSFAHAVRQYSKILNREHEQGVGFEHVFIAVHDARGSIYFFDTGSMPPRTGHPKPTDRLSVAAMIKLVKRTVAGRAARVAKEGLPRRIRFTYLDPA